MTLQIVELDPKLHIRQHFDCGNINRNLYLQKLAAQHRRSGFSSTYVLSDTKKPSTVFGYYSISAAQIELGVIPKQNLRKLPKVPIPAARVGQLAVDLKEQGKGYGALLLQNAIKKALLVREQSLGIHMIIVDADSQNAASFYRKFGFRECNSSGRTLYLCLGSD